MESMIDNDALGTLIAPDTVRIERILPGPVDRVWSYLVEGEKRRKWLAGGEMDDRVGGQVELKFRHSDFTADTPPERFADINKNGFTSQCRITEYDPPRLLAFTWPGDVDSEVPVRALRGRIEGPSCPHTQAPCGCGRDAKRVQRLARSSGSVAQRACG